MADAELGHYAAVAALAVGSDVEIKQMCVGILDRTGYSRCAVVTAAAGEHQSAALFHFREKSLKSGLCACCKGEVLDGCAVFSEQNISIF